MASGAGALRMNGYNNNNASNCGAGAMAAAENRYLEASFGNLSQL